MNSLPKTYPTASRLRFEPELFCARVQHANHSATEPPLVTIILSNLNRFLKISLEDTLVNLQLNGYLKFHRTLHMLLHYLVKH